MTMKDSFDQWWEVYKTFRLVDDMDKKMVKDGWDAACEVAIRPMVQAYAQLNAIRARDGIPYTRQGWPSGVSEEYFSRVVDDVNAAVQLLTGRSAHCHPELYAREE